MKQNSKLNSKTEQLANFKFTDEVQQVGSAFSHKPLKPKDRRTPYLVGTNRFHQWRPSRAEYIRHMQQVAQFDGLTNKNRYDREVA